jgi:hypothetical protein
MRQTCVCTHVGRDVPKKVFDAAAGGESVQQLEFELAGCSPKGFTENALEQILQTHHDTGQSPHVCKASFIYTTCGGCS